MSADQMFTLITLIQVDITFDSPLLVGSPEAPRGDDLPDVVPYKRVIGGVDSYWIPGTAVAGSLRATARSQGHDDWFGSAENLATAVPSPIKVVGTQFESAIGSDRVQRDVSTAIDRVRGAARNRSRKTQEFLQPGGHLSVFLRIDRDRSVSAPSNDQFVQLLAEWRPRLGRGVTTGFGRGSVSSVKIRDLDLGSVDGLSLWLEHRGVDLFTALLSAEFEQQIASGGVPAKSIAFNFKTTSPLAVGSGLRHDNASLCYRLGGDLSVSGRTWKGVFRSRAEVILRSIAPDEALHGGACLNQACGVCPACILFGSSPRRGGEGGRRGKAAFRTTKIVDGTTSTQTHAPIDRFTGGVARRSTPQGSEAEVGRDKLDPGLLHSVEVVDAGATLVVEIEVLEQGLVGWEKSLLEHVARDLHDGFVGLGSSTTRGYGWVELDVPDAVKPESLSDLPWAIDSVDGKSA